MIATAPAPNARKSSKLEPTPAALERAPGLAWYTEQLEALSERLWNYQGPDVYGKIFRQYCRETGLLNTLNVTEILTKAAQLK
jgi:hypothetical protein